MKIDIYMAHSYPIWVKQSEVILSLWPLFILKERKVNGAMAYVVKTLDSQSRGPLCSKPLGGFKVD